MAAVGLLVALIAICVLVVSNTRWPETLPENRNTSQDNVTAELERTPVTEPIYELPWNDEIASDLRTLQSDLDALVDATVAQ